METEVKKTESFWSWSGSPDDIRRMAATMAKEIEKYAAGLAQPPDDVDSLPIEEQLAAKKLALSGAMVPLLTATTADGALTFSGTVDEVLPEIDHRPLQQLSLKCGIRRNYSDLVESRVEFTSRYSTLKSVSVTVSGPDHGWVSGLQLMLVEQVKERVPWWAVLRNTAVRSIASFTLIVAFLGLVFVASSWFWTVCIVAAFLFNLWGASWACPPFEILQPGERSQGEKRLGVLVGAVGLTLSAAGVILAIV